MYFRGTIFPARAETRRQYGCAPFQAKQFVLWRGERRLVLGEEDLHTNRIASVCKRSANLLFLLRLSVRHP